MTKEEKELLLKELCARLPYGVKCKLSADGASLVEDLQLAGLSQFLYGRLDIKPYLRPMSDMTELEDKEYALLQTNFYTDGFLYPIPASNMINWLNEHHFDYQGLIERGLALEAPEGMYKIE